MGITYQTNNRQRRKVMTAPLNAPPVDLVAVDEAIADFAAPAPAPAARPGFFWVAAAVAGAACAAYALNLFL